MSELVAETFQNEYLAAGTGAVDAVVTVTAAGGQEDALPDVRLRLWTPKGAEIEAVRQVAPEVLDLTDHGVPSGPLARDYLLSGWSPAEARDYHLRIHVQPAEVGDEMAAGRVSLVRDDGSVATQTLVRAVWTEDLELATRIDRQVARYTGQIELADAIQSGLAAARRGDRDRATVSFGRAAQLAQASGHAHTLMLLAKVVHIDDAASGTVTLRPAMGGPGMGQQTEMSLDSRSTRTVHLRRREPAPAAGDEPAPRPVVGRPRPQPPAGDEEAGS